MKVKIGVTLDPEVLEKIVKLAEKDGRSISSYINKVLREHAEENL